jgi:chromosome segregation ATPase
MIIAGSIIVVLFFIGGVGALLLVITRKIAGGREVLEKNNRIREETLVKKKEILSDLAMIALGYVPVEDLHAAHNEIATLEETLRAQRGKLTITESELEAVETRQRELEEIERELEASNIEVGRELEMIRSQEHDLHERNEALKPHIENSMFVADLIGDDKSTPANVASACGSVKIEIKKMEEQIIWFGDQTSMINQKYMDLKRAYDALDIEYAQLYEKQNAMMSKSD